MSEYLERETAVNIADHAILEHPYDKDPQNTGAERARLYMPVPG